MVSHLLEGGDLKSNMIMSVFSLVEQEKYEEFQSTILFIHIGFKNKPKQITYKFFQAIQYERRNIGPYIFSRLAECDPFIK